MAANTFSVTVTRTLQAGPPRTMIGEFTGTPTPGLPEVRVPAPVLRVVSARCNVTPSFIPITRWFGVPAQQYSLSAQAVRR